MLACQTCRSQEPTIACMEWTRRTRTTQKNAAVAPWKAIQAEAATQFEHDPWLRPQLKSDILSYANLDEALGTILSEQLFPQSADRKGFQTIFQDALQSDPLLIQTIIDDLHAIRRNDPATGSLLQPFLFFKGFHAVTAHRVAHWLWKEDRKLAALKIQSNASQRFGVDIHPAAVIGSGLFIDHATGVVIGETSRIGNQVTILHEVTLGGTGKQSGDRHPKIGDRVMIGAGAKLLGNIYVGDNAKIGAGSVVVKDVPADATFVGIAAESLLRRRRVSA